MEPDEKVQQAIQRYIAERPDVELGALHVQVQSGVVTISGHLTSEAQKWQIEDALRATPGVQSLVNLAMLVPLGELGVTDSDIAKPWMPSSS